jgi:hypothetical protein
MSGSCENETEWSMGAEFMEKIFTTKINGRSGAVEFESETGFRKNFTLSIVDRTTSGVDLVNNF